MAKIKKDVKSWFDSHVIVSMPDSIGKAGIDMLKIKEKLKQKLAKEMTK